jgi:hypothetical protein
VNVGGLVLLCPSTKPLERKVAAVLDFWLEITQMDGWAE